MIVNVVRQYVRGDLITNRRIEHLTTFGAEVSEVAESFFDRESVVKSKCAHKAHFPRPSFSQHDASGRFVTGVAVESVHGNLLLIVRGDAFLRSIKNPPQGGGLMLRYGASR